MTEENLELSIALMESELSILFAKKEKIQSKIERTEMIISELRNAKN